MPKFCARLETFSSVPAAPNIVVTRPRREERISALGDYYSSTPLPKGMRASHGTGMVMVIETVWKDSSEQKLEIVDYIIPVVHRVFERAQ